MSPEKEGKAYKREGLEDLGWDLRPWWERIPEIAAHKPTGFTHLRKGFLGGPINVGTYN